MNTNLFSSRIKELRLNNKMTQQDLAQIVGLTPTGISYWESGKAIPNFETLSILSEFFNVSIDYLSGKNNINEDDKTYMLFRKAEKVDEDDKEKLFDIINSTIDVFLNNKK